jgi:hypothetical protein
MRTSPWFTSTACGWILSTLCLGGPSCAPLQSDEAPGAIQAIEEEEVDELVAPGELAATIHGTLSTLWAGLGGYVHATRGDAEMPDATLVVPDILIEISVAARDGEPPPPPLGIATVFVPDVRIERGIDGRPGIVTVPETRIELRIQTRHPASVTLPEIKITLSAADFASWRRSLKVPDFNVEIAPVVKQRVSGTARVMVPDLPLDLRSDGRVVITVPDVELVLPPSPDATSRPPTKHEVKVTVGDIKLGVLGLESPITVTVPDFTIGLGGNIDGTPLPDPATIVIPSSTIELGESCTVDRKSARCPIAATMPDIVIDPNAPPR